MLREKLLEIVSSKIDENIIQDLENLQLNLGLNQNDIVYEVEAQLLKTDNGVLTKEVYRRIQKQLETKKSTTQSVTPKRQAPILNNQIFQSQEKSPHEVNLQKSLQDGQVIKSLNPFISNELQSDLYQQMEVTVLQQQEKYDNLLNSNLIKRYSELSKRYIFMNSMFHEFLSLNQPDFMEFGDPNLSSFDSKYIFGRIIGESDGKLTAKSLLLECEDSKYKISLDLSKTDNYFLYSSQFVVLKGILKDNVLEVEKVFLETVLNVMDPIENMNEQNAIKKQEQPHQIQIIAVSGPYTTNDSINFTPLTTFINQIKHLKPNILIMSGPFVDRQNNIIKSGILESSNRLLTNEELLQEFVLKVQSEFPQTKIILSPSPDDVTSQHPLPQCPLEVVTNGKVLFIGNPATIKLQEDIHISLNNSQLLKDLTQSLIDNQQKNRIDYCLEQIINQRSLLPIYPSSDNIDIDKVNNFNFDNDDFRIPDIFILPSKLVEFAKLINETIFINPGLLCKDGIANGSYARIIIQLDQKNQTKIENRTRVDIHKL